MAIRIVRGQYVVYWREGDKQRSKYFGRGSSGKALAEEFDESIRKNSAKPVLRSGVTFSGIAKMYLKNHNLANENCTRHLEIRLSKMLSYGIGEIDAAIINSANIDRYVISRQKTVKNSTINRELNDIQAIMNFAKKRGILSANPIEGYPKLPNDDEIIIPPTTEEINLIYSAASPHIKRFIILCSYIIARPGAVEVLSIIWRQVSWGALVIDIIGAAKNRVKSSTRRQAPIQPGLMSHLRTWYDEDKVKFGSIINQKTIINYHGNGIRKIGKAWAGTLRRAGIDRRIRPYDLRHRSITEVLDKGGDIKALSAISGSSPQTLIKHYQHVSTRAHRMVAGLVSVEIEEP